MQRHAVGGKFPSPPALSCISCLKYSSYVNKCYLNQNHVHDILNIWRCSESNNEMVKPFVQGYMTLSCKTIPLPLHVSHVDRTINPTNGSHLRGIPTHLHMDRERLNDRKIGYNKKTKKQKKSKNTAWIKIRKAKKQLIIRPKNRAMANFAVAFC